MQYFLVGTLFRLIITERTYNQRDDRYRNGAKLVQNAIFSGKN